MGLQQLLMETNINVSIPMTIYCDNQATITQITGESSSKRSKHMDVRLKFVVDVVNKGIVMMKYLPSERMPADLMTKALSQTRVVELRTMCGLKRKSSGD